MYPFGSLPENLAAFCESLRRDHGFRIGPRELQDAARALVNIPLADERVVRDVLRPVLSHTHADVLVFDQAFRAFFHARAATAHPDERAMLRRERESDAPVARRPTADAAAQAREDERDDAALVAGAGVLTAGEPDREPAIAFLRSSYSALDAESAPPAVLFPSPEWRGAARAFVNRLHTGLSRRWRPAARGRRFDLRRTLRGSLHTGGEAVVPKWRARAKRRPRFVVLVDGSRSMDAHAHTALQFATALAAATRNLEVFTFSTALERVTRDVQRAAAGEGHPLRRLHHAWGGGTSIGGCLSQFVERFGERLLGPDTVVIVASDGLDVGDLHVLRSVMARLHRRSAGIIWLNPLLETRGYQPTAQGMRLARPYVTTFAWVPDPAGLLRLSRMVRLRA